MIPARDQIAIAGPSLETSANAYVLFAWAPRRSRR
jgi:hypothetical protein